VDVAESYSSEESYPGIDNCSFKGNITVNYKQIKERAQKEQEVSVGGIVGYSDHCNINNCIATGNITYKEQGDKAVLEE
ncbi:hypothetical protein GUH15_09380, partial [Xanthomonas citri pv. citri]|nr:hypothetical protein [Xanthomonas citri pv. citri]